MSAFLVQPKTLHRITCGLLQATVGSREGPGALPRPAEVYGTGALQCPDEEAMKALGQALWEMNLRALDARYDDNDEERATVQAGYHPRANFTDPIQLSKSLHCLLYQCHEGDVPEEPLYGQVEAFRDQLNLAIVASLPAYEAADWG